MALQGDNMVKVKISNRRQILKLLHEQGGMSRKRIAAQMGLTPAAITIIVGEMIKEGIIAEGCVLPANGCVGRREIMVDIRKSAFCALGITINIEDACFSAVDLEGGLLFSEHMSIQPDAPAQETVTMLAEELKKLIEKYSVKREKVLGLGVTVRGVIDKQKSRSVFSFAALKERDVPIKEMFERATGLPVVLENNVRSIFEAHIFMSKSRTCSSELFVRCEYGIGAALSINHRIWCGGSGKSAELGHIPVVPMGGKLCRCGKSGCLETISSPMAIREDVQSVYSKENTPLLYSMTGGADAKDVHLHTILEAARRGDKRTAEIVDHAITLLCHSIKAIIYTLDPDKVILYGRMFENSYYLARLEADMKTGFNGESEPVVEKSEFNLMLEDRAAGIVVVDSFFENGGILPLESRVR